MAKSDDLVKYITQQVVTYIDTPREVRRQMRQERRSKRREEPWSSRWFGLLPLSLKLIFGKKRAGTYPWDRDRPD
ncbi:YqzE family protein [Gorillibacterium sp. sgz5001074]|uniref:YqzE family protein n=1 Tax=Gorillibacterium sp. sgz5001074 TaxID=3446695 RepID=UPI003F66FAE0